MIAQNSKGVAGSQAKSILEAVYSQYVDECPDNTDGTAGYKNSQIGIDALNQTSGISISVKPNPARQWAAFDYTLPSGVTSAIIEISNMHGIIVESLNVSGPVGQKLWDTRRHEPGVYIYTLKTAAYSKSGKIIISK
jgi:hypothetical protein